MKMKKGRIHDCKGKYLFSFHQTNIEYCYKNTAYLHRQAVMTKFVRMKKLTFTISQYANHVVRCKGKFCF